MKIQEKKPVSAAPEKVWKVLTGFEEYRDWNPFLQKIDGPLELEAPLNISMAGLPSKRQRFSVSGIVQNKYFSFTAVSVLGGWWYHSEHVFRIVLQNGGSIEFVNEAYCHGLSLKFSKNKLSGLLRKGMAAMNNALKRRCEVNS